MKKNGILRTVVVPSFSRVQLFATPWTEARQASPSLLKFMSIELVMPSNHLILCCPLLLLPSIFPRIRVSSKKNIKDRFIKYKSGGPWHSCDGEEQGKPRLGGQSL